MRKTLIAIAAAALTLALAAPVHAEVSAAQRLRRRRSSVPSMRDLLATKLLPLEQAGDYDR